MKYKLFKKGVRKCEVSGMRWFRNLDLKKKMYFYSIFITVIVMVAFISYTIFMLPGLYNEKIDDINRKIAISVHDYVTENNMYKTNFDKDNGGYSINTLILSERKPEVELLNYQGKISIKIKDKKVIKIYLKAIRNMRQRFMENFNNRKSSNLKNKKLDFREITGLTYAELRDIKMIFEKKYEIKEKINPSYHYDPEKDDVEVEQVKKDTFMFTMTHREKGAVYVIRALVTEKNQKLYLTYSAYINSKFNHIASVILQSIPMVVLILMLLVLISSMIFSKSIIDPIIKLQKSTRMVSDFNSDALGVKQEREDEIGELSRDIDIFYKRLKTQYALLERENKKREIVLRSFSHKLKTPIAGAILIIDAMIDNVGDFRNNTTYLKKLRERIVESQEAVDRLLKLEYKKELEFTNVDVRELIENTINSYMAVEGKTTANGINISGNSIWNTDIDVFSEVIENLISNCFKHSSEGFDLNIEVEDSFISIVNTNANISQDILNEVFEPFVSEFNDKSSGLGLYIARYNADRLGIDIDIANVDKAVMTKLTRKEVRV